MKISTSCLISVLFVGAKLANAQNTDRFHYRATDGTDFGPEDWDQVSCDDLDTCLGWPQDSWTQRLGWTLGGNNCEWCPEGTTQCGAHRQSPIDFDRNVADPNDGDFEDPPDWHWMKYERMNCVWEDIVNNQNARTPNQFRIQRHALQILQPVGEDNKPKCPNGQGGGTFPRVDYSKGWKWWWLTNTEIIVPSEHFQEGKQYDAEVHLSHAYSLSPDDPDGREDREMGKMGIFMQVYDNIAPWPFLDKLICQWRKVEEETREACGYGSVLAPYPGCWNYDRPDPAATPSGARKRERNLRADLKPVEPEMSESERLRSIDIGPEMYEQDPNYTVEDFEQDIKDYNADYARQYEVESNAEGGHRFLMNYDHVMYHPYEWMFKVQTEYYFRYEGTQTTPPCFEQLHWRFLKDPIRIHERQLRELERLLAERIAPLGSQFNECQPDTAGKPRGDGSNAVDVNRPLQYRHNQHNMMMTECKDWGSKQDADQKWCKIEPITERLFNHPYNFDHVGF